MVLIFRYHSYVCRLDFAVQIDQALVEIDSSAPRPKTPDPPPEPKVQDPTPPPAAAAQSPPKPAKSISSSVSSTLSVPSLRGERRVPMSRMRLKIAQRLKESQNAAAMLTTFNEIDCSQLIAVRL